MLCSVSKFPRFDYGKSAGGKKGRLRLTLGTGRPRYPLSPSLATSARCRLASSPSMYLRSLRRLPTSFNSPRRLAWSFLCCRKCSVSSLMRAVRIAIWTSGDPVSFGWVRFSSITAARLDWSKVPFISVHSAVWKRCRSRGSETGAVLLGNISPAKKDTTLRPRVPAEYGQTARMTGGGLPRLRDRMLNFCKRKSQASLTLRKAAEYDCPRSPSR